MRKADEVRLKPCPYCGGDAVFTRYATGSVAAGCGKCGRKMFVSNGDEHAVARMWNRRVDYHERTE